MSCGRALAFDAATLTMVSEEMPGSGLPFCANREGSSRCNWLAPDAASCLSCQVTRTIPSLSKPENHNRWRKLELAKRRLLYDVMRLGLPVDPGALSFVFKEDRRTNPDVYDEHVSIGHEKGLITINAAEADEIYRETMRQAMNEPVRTLLGHFRHEAGHYFFDAVIGDAHLEDARALFGDESVDYDSALQQYYSQGPVPDWAERFISSYASAHPSEDWAECWAHYLHIRAVLEVAESTGLTGPIRPANWRSEFVELIVSVNEIMRSLGLADAYPFILNDEVASKIEFIHRRVVEAATPVATANGSTG